jgi:Domain of unknown function (DUF6458)
MKTATGLTLVAIGAILAFAVNAHLQFLNLQVVGWVIILTGIAGIFVPRSAYGQMRRRVVYRRTPRAGAVSVAGDASAAPYIVDTPAPPAVVDTPAPPVAVDTSTPPIEAGVTGPFDAAEPAVPPSESEIVEEYFEE